MSRPSVLNSEMADVPKSAVKLYQEALLAGNSGDSKAAIDKLKSAVTEYPRFVLAYNELALQYIKRNDFVTAEDYLRTALKLKSDSYEPLVNFGILLFWTNHLVEAEVVVREVLRLKAQSSLAHFYLGRILTRQDKFDEAEKELIVARASEDSPMVEADRMLADLYIRKGENEKAIKRLEMYLKEAPHAPDEKNLRRVISQLKQSKTGSGETPTAPVVR